MSWWKARSSGFLIIVRAVEVRAVSWGGKFRLSGSGMNFSWIRKSVRWFQAEWGSTLE